MQEKLVQVTETLGMVGYMTNQEMLVELYDANCTLVFCEGFQGASARLSLGDTAGSDIDWIQSTLETGGVNRSTTSDDSGRPMERTYVPVTDCGEVVGCIVTGYYPASGGGVNEVAIEKAETFMDSIDRINNAIDMMTIHFENLFDKLQEMQDKTGNIGKGVAETSVVVSKIKANASKSKILALNASIEAARSGEAGRGFTVVAKEMGEMATASGTSAVEINTALKSIFGDLDEITASISTANELAEKQTGSIKDIEEYLGVALQAAMELGEALQNS
ncbi:MAG: methyl-accepting chemotaxis protein [Lachnospiraceae bacterium]|nr:methyl-accepting chemotaxis protein [Lachnospiraceae bacterium]